MFVMILINETKRNFNKFKTELTFSFDLNNNTLSWHLKVKQANSLYKKVKICRVHVGLINDCRRHVRLCRFLTQNKKFSYKI